MLNPQKKLSEKAYFDPKWPFGIWTIFFRNPDFQPSTFDFKVNSISKNVLNPPQSVILIYMSGSIS